MATCDSEFEGVWREANRLLSQAFFLLAKVSQGSEVEDKDIQEWTKKLTELEKDCDERNILTLLR